MCLVGRKTLLILSLGLSWRQGGGFFTGEMLVYHLWYVSVSACRNPSPCV